MQQRSDDELWKLATSKSLKIPDDITREELERIQRIGLGKEIELRAEFARKRGQK
jgi:hypothetical protein